MKARFDRSFERGQDLVKVFLTGALVTGLASVLLVPSGSVLQMILIFLSAALLIAMIVSAWKLCRCPYCGRAIIFGALAVTVCPSCHRDLKNGKKVKKSRR